MISYDTCLSVSDLFQSVWSSLGPSTFLRMALFHSFLWLSNIPLYLSTTSSLSISLLVDIEFFFHVLGIVNSAAVNAGMQGSFRVMFFSGWILYYILDNKVWHCFHRFPIYFPWSGGTRCHDLSFLNVEPTFSLSCVTFIKRLFSSFSLPAILYYIFDSKFVNVSNFPWVP